MLDAYLTQTRRLLQLPAAPVTLYSDANLTAYINTARGQLAGEAECIRKIGTVTAIINQRAYNFSAINLGVSATTGIDGAINVRRVAYIIANGQKWIPPRAWEWFDLYCLNNVVPTAGAPERWSQYGQGAAPGSTGSGNGGSLYLDPPPDIGYTLSLDCTCYPIALANDATVEAIPYLWTDAVPYFAAYYALLSSQTQARMADAMKYLEIYTQFVKRARVASNPSVGRWQYSQAQDPPQAAKLGLQRSATGGG